MPLVTSDVVWSLALCALCLALLIAGERQKWKERV